MAEEKPNPSPVDLTIITGAGAHTSGPMPERDADIVAALTEIAGGIASPKPAKHRH